jgi:hypothetical protein
MAKGGLNKKNAKCYAKIYKNVAGRQK